MTSPRPDRANNPDELLDLVDENDRVIGTVLKAATERDPGLVHREVAILIHRDDELLWQLRSDAKTVMPGTWDIACAGQVVGEYVGADGNLHGFLQKFLSLGIIDGAEALLEQRIELRIGI